MLTRTFNWDGVLNAGKPDLASKIEAKLLDTYLGFGIFKRDDGVLAIPGGWGDDVEPLQAADVPKLRKRIWFWWHPAAA